jgi:hypothetical protein
MGRQHFAQILGKDLCQATAAGWTTVLEYLVLPGHHWTGLYIPINVDSDNGCTVRATAVEPAVAVGRGCAAGPVAGKIDLAGINRQDTLTTLRIQLELAGGGTWASIEAISCHDADLAAVP